MSNIIEPFKTPIYETSLSLDTNKIFTYCKKIQKNDKGVQTSNLGGWHSLPLNGKHLQLNELFEDIEYHSNIFGKKCNFKDKVTFDKIWININSTNNSNEAHTHPNSMLSGVYYVKTPKNCGDILFYNPAYETMEYDWSNKFNDYNNYNSSRFLLPAVENNLYIFPSWLKHLVKPNLSKKERMSISFNLI